MARLPRSPKLWACSLAPLKYLLVLPSSLKINSHSPQIPKTPWAPHLYACWLYVFMQTLIGDSAERSRGSGRPYFLIIFLTAMYQLWLQSSFTVNCHSASRTSIDVSSSRHILPNRDRARLCITPSNWMSSSENINSWISSCFWDAQNVL